MKIVNKNTGEDVHFKYSNLENLIDHALLLTSNSKRNKEINIYDERNVIYKVYKDIDKICELKTHKKVDKCIKNTYSSFLGPHGLQLNLFIKNESNT